MYNVNLYAAPSLYSIYKNRQIVGKCAKNRLIYHDFCGIINSRNLHHGRAFSINVQMFGSRCDMQRRMIRMTPARRSKITGRVFYEIYRYEDTGKLYPYSCNFAVHAWRICLHHDLQQYRKSGKQQHDRFGAGRGGARILGDAFLYQHCKGAWHNVPALRLVDQRQRTQRNSSADH